MVIGEWWERPKSREIIFTLKHLGSLTFSELAEVTGGSFVTIEKRLKELNHLGLVKILKDKLWPFRLHIALTRKGEVVFRLLNRLVCDFSSDGGGGEGL